MAQDSYDLIVAADEPAIEAAADELRLVGVEVEAVIADLATEDGVQALLGRIRQDGRAVELLFANAGRGLGNGFLNQDAERWRYVIETNITGTLLLIQAIGRQMRRRGAGAS